MAFLIYHFPKQPLGFPASSDGKESVYSVRDLGLIPRLGRSLGEGNGKLLQCSCLEKPMNRRAWRANSSWGQKELDTTEWLSLNTASRNCWHHFPQSILQVSQASEQLRGGHLGLAAFSCTWQSSSGALWWRLHSYTAFQASPPIALSKQTWGGALKHQRCSSSYSLRGGIKSLWSMGFFFPSQLKEVDLLLFTNLLSSLRQNMNELKKTNNGEQGG